MALKVFAGISLRNDDGVHFGTLVRIRTGVAGVQTDALYRVGDRVEFQLELLGFDTMVQGIGEVVRADPRPEELSSYLLRIRKMRRSDQALLQEWYDQQLAGLEPSLRGEDDGRALDSQVESQLPSDIGAERPTPAKLAEGKGREAIRNLLLDAAETAEPSGETGGAAADEPAIALDRSCTPPRLLVAYRTQGAWQRDRDAQLLRGMLFLHLDEDERLELDTRVELHIQRPPLPPVESGAVVVLLHDRGMGLRLDLDPASLA
jgi:Tfp pilus assembly protein PilZ